MARNCNPSLPNKAAIASLILTTFGGHFRLGANDITRNRSRDLRDVVCWIPISAVHLFKLVSSCFGNRRYRDLWTLKLINDFCGQCLLRVKLSFEWKLNPGFGTQKKCPFPYNRVNNYKDYANIFPGPNFVSPEWRCPLNRTVPKERFHCIYLSIMWKKRMVSLRCSGQETKILNEKYIMQYIK